MPAVIPAHIALRAKLEDSVRHALALNSRLENLIAVKSRGANSGGFHGKIDFSQPPWCAPVANAVMDLHAQAREAEGCLRISLKLPYRDRGGSDGNTRRAMEAILRLCEGADDGAVRANVKWIESWCRRASIALGEKEIPCRLPRIEGRPEPACPWCKNRTLRMEPLKGVVRCVNPACRDPDGSKPVARLEYSKFTAQMELIWQDNIVGLP